MKRLQPAAPLFLLSFFACGEASPPATSPARAAITVGPPPDSVKPPTSGAAPHQSVSAVPIVADRDAPFVAVRTSVELEAVRHLGLDPEALPPFESLTSEQKRGLMPIFSASLGVPCTGCHASQGHDGPLRVGEKTRNTEIAKRMWDDFTRDQTDDFGSPIGCDSCHAGRAKLFDRSNDQAVLDFMDKQYVVRLANRKTGNNTCATCHGPDLTLEIFSTLWEIPPGP